MTQLLGSSFSKLFIQDVGKSQTSITIISPYVTEKAAQHLLEKIPKKVTKRLVITLPPGPEYITGAVEIAALKKLESKGFDLRYIRNLHAKIYLLDDRSLYLGSANFTSSGWELDKGNVEEMLHISLTKKEIVHVQERYISRSKPLTLSDEWIEEIEQHSKKLKKQYELMIGKMEEMVGDYPLGGFSVFSSYKTPPNGKRYYFQFNISGSTVREIVKEKMDFLFKLGGSKESPHVFLDVPFQTMKQILSKDHQSDSGDNWQFQISVDSDGKFILGSTLNKKANKTNKRIEIELDAKTKRGQFRG